MSASVGTTGRIHDSLKLRLALSSVLLILASVALIVHVVLDEVHRVTELVVLDSLENEARSTASVLSGRLIGLQLALRSAAGQLKTDQVLDAGNAAAFLDNKPVLGTLFSAVFVLRPDGRMLAVRDDQGTHDPGISVADRVYFKETLSLNRTLVSQPILSRVSGEPAIVITFPVHDRNGRLHSMIGGSLRLSTRAFLGDLTRVDREGDSHSSVVTIVTDSAGRIISHPSKEWVLKNGAAEPRIAAAVADWVARGRPIESTGFSLHTDAYEVGIAGVPDADWVVFRSGLADELLAGVAQGEKRARWLGLCVAVVGGALTLLITAWLLRPLHKLKSRALRLLVEDIDDQAGWPHVSGELGDLARVFQHVIQQRHLASVSSQSMLAKLRAVMAKAPVGISFTREHRFELVSDDFKRMLGYEAQGLEGRLTRVIHPSDEMFKALELRIGAAFRDMNVFDDEVEFVRLDGSRFWGRLHGAPVSEKDPSAGSIWTLENVTVARQRRQALSWSATHDDLTRLANRHEFEYRVTNQLEASRAGEAACVLFIDLDRFKSVNDGGGHAAGDQLLREVAAILTERVRHGDCVARVGGDEFGVLLRGCSLDAALVFAEQLRERVEQHTLRWDGTSFSIGASIGVVVIGADMADAASVIAAADAACYVAKRAGRNAVCTHEPKVAAES